MAKTVTTYVCTECGTVSPKWLGRCPNCGAWNTFAEEIQVPESAAKTPVRSFVRPQPLSAVREEKFRRIKTGVGEFDRVLGGGIVPASMVLLGGDPGIGKSTLLTEVAGGLSREHKVLYISAEESASQLKMRCNRLGVQSDTLLVMNETVLENIEACADGVEFLIVDSIQAVYLDALSSSAGSVGQVRECASRLMRLAKAKNITVFLVGHVTKEGAIAGPKVLEHIMDTVLYFEGDAENNYRILRAVKNRYGSTNEIGVFDMGENGLQQVENPSQAMLSGRPKDVSGTCVTAVMEGTRPILAEIQGRATTSGYGNPRRMATGFDYNRMYLLLAVLEKRAGYAFYNQDVYINIIGGLKLDETACDLPVCIALASSLLDLPVDEKTIAIGEVGLGGEVRSVTHLETRLREAQRVGFDTAIVPKHNLKMIDPSQFPSLKLVGVSYLREAINAIKLK